MLNLKEYGFKITWDPADESGHRDPLMMQIPCALGLIYLHGESTLGVECKSATGRRLREILGVTLHQDGEDGQTLIFNQSCFEEVARIVRPRKKRKLSNPELVKYQFRPK